MTRDAEISWFTPPIGDRVGYGYAAVSLIRAIQKKRVKVVFNSNEPLVHISFIQPEYYNGEPNQHKIGYTPWESTEIPQAWPFYMGQQDEMWTTSRFCQAIFAKYDIESKVVSHGIDPNYFTIYDRYVGDKFYFFHMGGPTGRKGGQKVVDTFIDLFDGNKDVQLILKSNGPTETRWRTKKRYFGSAKNHPQIYAIEKHLEIDQLVALYHQAHCMVYPSNGEGFGLIPFQALATGMPTICTNATGCTEFATMSEPLNWERADGYGVHLGQWAEPDTEHLRELMLKVYNNYKECKKKALHAAHIIHEEQTWDCIADQVLEILGDKIYKRAGDA